MYHVVNFRNGDRYGFPKGIKKERMHSPDFAWYEWFEDMGVPASKIQDAMDTKVVWHQEEQTEGGGDA